MIAAIENGRPLMSEQQIVSGILTYLAVLRIPFIHHRNTGSICRRGSRIFFARQPHHQRGIADIIVCHRGFPIAIEVKTTVGRVSPEQVEWLRDWQKAGGLSIVARSVDAVEAYFDDLNRRPPRI